jgi:hypothetical protein
MTSNTKRKKKEEEETKGCMSVCVANDKNNAQFG